MGILMRLDQFKERKSQCIDMQIIRGTCPFVLKELWCLDYGFFYAKCCLYNNFYQG
jgi:hypothetical protein